MTLAFWRGDVVDAAAACLPIDDRGVTNGLGVFETIRVIEGRVFALTRHLARLSDGAQRIGATAPDSSELRTAVMTLVSASDLSDARVRITLTAGPPSGAPLWWVTVEPRPVPSDYAHVVVASWRRNELAPLTGVKTTSYADNAVARAWAASRGADEVLFANTRGDVCEGSSSNVFVVRDGTVATPPLSSGCLPGVVRSLVVETCEVVEVDLPLAALTDAEEVFLTSSLRHVQPVASVDGRTLPHEHRTTHQVAERMAQLVATTDDP